MSHQQIAILLYGSDSRSRDAATEDKYKDLVTALRENDLQVKTVVYHDRLIEAAQKELLEVDIILVWINPVEQNNDRKKLDEMLRMIAAKGKWVSAHPEVILSMGTKDVLYKTRNCAFGSDVKLYRSYEEFEKNIFLGPAIKVLKQYRGNGGNGVFKIDSSKGEIASAERGGLPRVYDRPDFLAYFKKFFIADGLLIEQPWNENIGNGMVRCYLSGSKVAGFGYQEVNALYPGKEPGKRYYFSEDCGLFADLKKSMEVNWINEIKNVTGVAETNLPLIWDADFFINDVNCPDSATKYTLCEINVSCVSPFPPSAIPFIVEHLKQVAH